MKRENKNMAYLYLVLTISAWGSIYVVSKFVLATIPPVTILFFRYLTASIVLLIIIRFRKKNPIEKSDYKYIFFIGFLGNFVAIGAQMVGTKLANASIASLINAMNPIFMILFAVPILKEKITVTKVIAVAASVLGAYSVLGGAGSGGETLGVLFSLFSVVLWSLMSVVVRRITQKYDPIVVTTYAIIIAMLCTGPAALIELHFTQHGRMFSLPNIICLLYMGIICTAMSHLLWNKSLSMMEAGKCSMFYPLQPVVSVLLGSLFLGEIINMNFVIGAILIIGSIFLNILPVIKGP